MAPAGAAAFATMLAAHAVSAAPAGLMQSTLAASVGGAAAGVAGAGASAAIAKGAITMMTWTKTKIAAAVVVAAVLGTGTVWTINTADAQQPAEKVEATAAVAEEETDQDKPSLVTAPPVVVKSVPQSGSTGVDPNLKEIRVTYSKNMKDGSWSWSTWDEENFPKLNGKPSYAADRRTAVLPVKLEPNKFYAIWLNSNNFGNFQDTGGRPAVPYLLVFKTK
jgi:RNA polymerase sigma-70 factor (ECF subfamily)